jgi:hypothetical protein
MGALRILLILVHLLAAVGLLLTALAGARSTERMPPGMLHCAVTMLVTGVLLIGVDHGLDRDVNNARAVVKTLVLLVVLALILVNRRRSRVSAGLFPAVAGLTLFNATLAFVW